MFSHRRRIARRTVLHRQSQRELTVSRRLPLIRETLTIHRLLTKFSIGTPPNPLETLLSPLARLHQLSIRRVLRILELPFLQIPTLPSLPPVIPPFHPILVLRFPKLGQLREGKRLRHNFSTDWPREDVGNPLEILPRKRDGSHRLKAGMAL